MRSFLRSQVGLPYRRVVQLGRFCGQPLHVSAVSEKAKPSRGPRGSKLRTVEQPWSWIKLKNLATNRLEPDHSDKVVVPVLGVSTAFDPLFLRDSCQCASCVDPYSGQKKFETTDIPKSIRAWKVHGLRDGSLQVHWRNDVAHSPANHSSQFSKDFFSKNAAAWRRNPFPNFTPWDRVEMQRNCEKVSYEDFMTTTEGFEKVLDHTQKYGLVVISGVPEDESSVERIGEKIGPLRHSFYGRTWDVKDKPKAENVAYTSTHLGLHMDLLYMKNPPGLQLLHCIRSSATGGESLFADSFYAAKVVQAASRKHYEYLCTFPVTYHYQKGDHHFIDSKPVIEFTTGSIGSEMFAPGDIAAMNWAPPFQGPFKVDVGLEDNGRRLHDWHEAATAFSAIINDKDSLYRYQMQEGDCVIFNNRRVLHGRTAFESGSQDGSTGEETKPRWLKGAYLDMDDFRSKIRVMEARRHVAAVEDTQ